ncbi:AAA family ATPase [Sphingomonas sp. UYP23]
MKLRSLRLENFRKFRTPLSIDGFTDGLNIVVEPNETGKSTVLEAMQAALFTRYSATGQLVQSYCPFNDDVSPRIEMSFDLPSGSWTLEKQFLRGRVVKLTGPTGRYESEAAEEQLQRLLGFERGGKGADLDARGPLGLLWVEQTKGLSVSEPGRLVRDSVRGVLEAEVGAVTGGRRFDAIRAAVEAGYTALRTAKTGASKGDLLAAETRVVTAAAERARAEAALRSHEQSLGELENARTRLRLVERDLVDPEAVARRVALVADLQTGESAQLRLTTAQAQHAHADAVARALDERLRRIDLASVAVGEAAAARGERDAARVGAQVAVDLAASAEREARAALDRARSDREEADRVSREARGRVEQHSIARAKNRARELRRSLSELERRVEEMEAQSVGEVDAPALASLAKLERAAIEARARFAAGTVRVDFSTSEGVVLLVDGVPAEDASSLNLVKATRLTLGDAGSILIVPPGGAGLSIEAAVAAADEALGTALRTVGVASHASAVTTSERAASAKRELASLRKQMSALCPGDPVIGLAAGADALRSYVATLGEDAGEDEAPNYDGPALDRAALDSRTREASAVGRHDDARTALSNAERDLATAVAEHSGAVSAEAGAAERFDLLLGEDDKAALLAAFQESQRERARRAEALISPSRLPGRLRSTRSAAVSTIWTGRLPEQRTSGLNLRGRSPGSRPPSSGRAR